MVQQQHMQRLGALCCAIATVAAARRGKSPAQKARCHTCGQSLGAERTFARSHRTYPNTSASLILTAQHVVGLWPCVASWERDAISEMVEHARVEPLSFDAVGISIMASV
jgi:hypothetical protein